MKKLDEYPIFANHLKSLRDISLDDSDLENPVFMTDSPLIAVDFDAVKTEYVNALYKSEESASSVDAISENGQNHIMIEFKNGDLHDSKQKVSIKKKIPDSLLLYNDIVGSTISETRKNLIYILVYNGEKNRVSNQQRNAHVQPSASRDDITKRLHVLADNELIRFDLSKYKDLYFKEVHTYTAEEFSEYQKSLVSIT